MSLSVASKPERRERVGGSEGGSEGGSGREGVRVGVEARMTILVRE